MRDQIFDVENEVVVITGVGGQLGYQYASGFLKRGSKVVGLDIRESPRVRSLLKESIGIRLVPTHGVSNSMSLESSRAALFLQSMLNPNGFALPLLTTPTTD